MQKTRLGISVGLLGAALFLSCLFGGYVISILLAVYILLFEENAWLKKATVKGIVLMFGFSLVSAIIYLIPNAITFIDKVFNVFGGDFQISFVTNIVSVIDSALGITEKILFIALAIKALNQGTVKIPMIDSLVDKYMH